MSKAMESFISGAKRPRRGVSASAKPIDAWRKAERAANAGKHEAELARIYDEQGIKYKRQFKAIPSRQFTWDFFLGGSVYLVEVQGGIWVKSGHSSGRGISRDAEKANIAAVNGFYTLFFTPEHIADGRALRWTREALGNP
jgi:hypothetical protein